MNSIIWLQIGQRENKRMKVFFAILAVILLVGMIGDKEQQNRNNYTMGFLSTIIGLVALYVID